MDDNSLSVHSLPQHISHLLLVASNSSTLEKALEILTETSRTSDGRLDLASKNILPAVLLLCQNLSYPSSRHLLLLSLKLLRNLCAGELTNQNSFVEHDGVTILLTTLHSVITCDSDFAIIRMGLQVLANVSLAGELHQLAIWDKFFPLMFFQISSIRRRETCDPLCMVIYTCCDGSNELFGKLWGDQGLPILVEIVWTASAGIGFRIYLYAFTYSVLILVSFHVPNLGLIELKVLLLYLFFLGLVSWLWRRLVEVASIQNLLRRTSISSTVL